METLQTSAELLSQKNFYKHLADDIRSAQKSIDIHFYIAKKDRITQEIFTAMADAASRGIPVRCIADSVFSTTIFPPFSATSARRAIRQINRNLPPGARHIEYHHSRQKGDPLHPLQRNHKKLVVIDADTSNAHGWVGGSNLAGKFYPWRDTMTQVTGDIASALEEDFRKSWDKTNQGFHSYPVGRPEDKAEILVDSKGTEGINQRMVREIDKAEGTVWLETSYVRGRTIRDALIRAKKRGVDVKLIVPYHKTSNDFPYKLKPNLWLSPLVQGGVEVYVYGRKEKQFSHAKTLITDDVVVVGSSNFVDGKVVGGNAELVFLTHDHVLYNQAKTWIEEGIKQAELYKKDRFL